MPFKRTLSILSERRTDPPKSLSNSSLLRKLLQSKVMTLELADREPLASVCARFPSVIRRRSNQTCLQHSQARFCIPSPPVHGQRSPMHVMSDWHNRRQLERSYPATVAARACLLDLAGD